MKISILAVAAIVALPFSSGRGLRALGPRPTWDDICHYDSESDDFDLLHVPDHSAHFTPKHPFDVQPGYSGTLSKFDECDRECADHSIPDPDDPTDCKCKDGLVEDGGECLCDLTANGFSYEEPCEYTDGEPYCPCVVDGALVCIPHADDYLGKTYKGRLCFVECNQGGCYSLDFDYNSVTFEQCPLDTPGSLFDTHMAIAHYDMALSTNSVADCIGEWGFVEPTGSGFIADMEVDPGMLCGQDQGYVVDIEYDVDNDKFTGTLIKGDVCDSPGSYYKYDIHLVESSADMPEDCSASIGTVTCPLPP